MPHENRSAAMYMSRREMALLRKQTNEFMRAIKSPRKPNEMNTGAESSGPTNTLYNYFQPVSSREVNSMDVTEPQEASRFQEVDAMTSSFRDINIGRSPMKLRTRTRQRGSLKISKTRQLNWAPAFRHATVEDCDDDETSHSEQDWLRSTTTGMNDAVSFEDVVQPQAISGSQELAAITEDMRGLSVNTDIGKRGQQEQQTSIRPSTLRVSLRIDYCYQFPHNANTYCPVLGTGDVSMTRDLCLRIPQESSSGAATTFWEFRDEVEDLFRVVCGSNNRLPLLALYEEGRGHRVPIRFSLLPGSREIEVDVHSWSRILDELAESQRRPLLTQNGLRGSRVGLFEVNIPCPNVSEGIRGGD